MRHRKMVSHLTYLVQVATVLLWEITEHKND